MMKTQQQGFTLIEIVIALVILGILMAIAIPSYQNYLTKTRRTDAKTALMELSQLQETYFADNNRYAGSDSGDPFNQLNAERHGFVLKDGKFYSKEGFYRLDFTRVSDTYFQIKAYPEGIQADGEEDLGKQCNIFIIESTGKREIEGTTNNKGNVKDCWG